MYILNWTLTKLGYLKKNRQVGLNMRSVHHQKDGRIESHIYLTILTYQRINAIRPMLKRPGINYGDKI